MTQIGRYEIVKRTGNHGLDSFYEAFDPVMRRSVTIRIADHAPEQVRERATADQLIELDHPNILKILAADIDGDRPYLVLETFDGVTVASILGTGNEIPIQQVMKFLRRSAEAVDYAHSKGLVHGRITPDALLLDAGGELKVTGFEAAPADSEDPELLLACVPYLSPEFIKGDAALGYSDQYSLAVITCEMLTGALPFEGESTIAILQKIGFENPVFPSLSGARFSPVVRRVLERALSKAPVARYTSCSEFAVEMEAALTARQSMPTRLAAPAATFPASAPVSNGTGGTPLLQDRRVMWAAVAVVVVLAIALVFLIIGNPSAPQQAKPAVSPPSPVRAVAAPAQKIVPPRDSERAQSTKAVKPVRSAKKAVAQPADSDREKKSEPVKLKPVEPKIP
jgi:serine/threonine protein kinase